MLWGAFNNASSAMIAQSWDMGTVSQNIANLNTNGYKRKDTEFKTVLSETHAAPAAGTSGLSIFGVKTADRYMITQQGQIHSTGNWSDVAINGRGFFVVSEPATNGAPQGSVPMTDNRSILYTRDGGFVQRSVNGLNYFTTASGQYLMGWQADGQGRIPGVVTSSQSAVSSAAAASTASTGTPSLVPVYTQPGTTLDGVATSVIQPVINLPSNFDGTAQVHRADVTVADPANNQHTLTLTWTRTGADSWDVTYDMPDGQGIPPAGATAVTLDDQGNVSSPVGGLPGITIDWSPIGQAAALASPAIDLDNTKPDMGEAQLSLTVYDNAYQAHTLNAYFEKSAADTWNLRIKLPSSEGTLSSFGAGGSASGVATSIPIQFDGAGQIKSPAPATVSLTVDWTAAGAGSNDLTIDLTNLTQFSDPQKQIMIKTIDQDGYGTGNLIGTSFNELGELVGSFDNGHTRTLFKVPVATFVAADQLDPVSGTLFRRTEGAGDVSVAGIEEQGSGAALVGASVETSNVDLEDEFTRMIVTQKAYSSNATVFRTADEMTTTARDLLA